MKILWSPEAIGDLASLRAYIAEDDPAAARGVVLNIIHNVELLLPNNPQMGPSAAENRTSIILGAAQGAKAGGRSRARSLCRRDSSLARSACPTAPQNRPRSVHYWGRRHR